MDPKEFQLAWAKVVAKAWSDEPFKKRLLGDPRTVLKEHSIEMPAEAAIRVMENSATEVHLVLPERPSDDLSIEELDKVAGGYVSLGCGRMSKIGPEAIVKSGLLIGRNSAG